MRVAVLGAGAWGTALGLLLHQNGHAVVLWGHDPGHLAAMAAARCNTRHLPGVALPEAWRFTASLGEALAEAEAVVVAVPSSAFRGIVASLSRFQGLVVTVTKGIEHSTGLTMSGVLAEVAPGAVIGALSGPSLAMEVARRIPTAVVAAAADPKVAEGIQALFHRPAFRVYTSTDLTGVELGGALKNVIAIAAGVCDGLGFGSNSKAALLTRGLAEMTRLGVACGGRAASFAGLSGLGDLTVTCFSPLSRNRSFGERLGRGERVEAILAARPDVVEGHPTARSALELARRLEVDVPIIEQVDAMIHHGKEPQRAVEDLLQRESRPELR